MADVYINGKAHDYNHTHIFVAGDEYKAITAVSYDADLPAGKGYGTHAQAVAETEGQFAPTASITLLKATASAIRNKLSDQVGTGKSWMLARFDITVNYEVDGLDMTTDEIIQCRVTKVSNSHQSGTDALTEVWDLSPLDIKLDGFSCVDEPLY